LHFLVDAQLPPALCHWLKRRGHLAEHARDLDPGSQSDAAIAAHAAAMGAIVITKDADFSHLVSAISGCRVVWLRFGNATSRDLIATVEPVFSEVEQALAKGQTLIEISR
jgi:predicted nuclease of predicted toxin-antitoxin system